MFRKILFFLGLIAGGILMAQQNDEFRLVKQYFDNQRSILLKSFENEMRSGRPEYQKALIRQHFAEFMVKMDSVQNNAYLTALVKVKNLEDLQRISSATLKNGVPDLYEGAAEGSAEYPGGYDAFRKELKDLFYSGAIMASPNPYKTTIRFIVERDGSISTVQAAGENAAFNKQAILAVYLLPNRFQPARINGVPVRSKFSLPLTLQFE